MCMYLERIYYRKLIFYHFTVLSLDAMDSSGEQHLHIDHNIFKRRLDKSGNPIEEPKKESMYRINLSSS